MRRTHTVQALGPPKKKNAFSFLKGLFTERTGFSLFAASARWRCARWRVLIRFDSARAGRRLEKGADGGDQLGPRGDGAGALERAQGLLLRGVRLHTLPRQRCAKQS